MYDSDDQQVLQKALFLHQAGDLAEAAKLYRQIIISQNPQNTYALHYLGVIEAALGNYEQAKAYMDQSLSTLPPNIQFVQNYATILAQMGDYTFALEISRRGLQVDRANQSLLYVSAVSLYKLERYEESLQEFDKLLLLVPNHIAAINDRGSVLAEMKKYEAALASFQQVLSYQPQLAEAHVNRANVLALLNNHSDALAAYDKSLALKPNSADAWLGRGNVLRQLNRNIDALTAYDRALTLKPDLVGAWLGRGNIFNELRDFNKATAAFDKALEIKPDLAEAWLGRGNVFVELKSYREAQFAYDRALTLQPELAQAWLGRGNMLCGLKSYYDAQFAYDRALSLKSDLANAWLGRGNVLMEFKHYADAIAAYDRALALNSDLKYTRGNRLHAQLQLADWTNLGAEISAVLLAVREQKSVISPFPFLAISSSPSDQLACAKCYAGNHLSFPALWSGEIHSHERIRVAYLSADFHNHPVAQLTVGLLERHDRSRFQTMGISFGPDDGSELRDRIKSAFEDFIEAGQMSDEEVARLIRRREIDLVIDLTGFTAGYRLDVLARRAAPIQVNYLGYPGTMGANYIDYIIADSTIIPQEHFEFYSEKVIWLPDCYQANDVKRPVSTSRPTRSQCALPETAFVFCCFNNTYKITPEVFDIWMRLLAAGDNRLLWLIGTNPTAEGNLRREAKKRGISADRLIFAPRVPLADHLARSSLADLFLDTAPYNAHTTGSDALWAGVPLVTCIGSTFASRVGASLLKAIGLDDLITSSLQDYEALAYRLANDTSTLRAYREQLERNHITHPLFDADRFTCHIEAAYTAMWHRYQKGMAPKAFGVHPAEIKQ
jgi:protein O-GlcNAc transferase